MQFICFSSVVAGAVLIGMEAGWMIGLGTGLIGWGVLPVFK